MNTAVQSNFERYAFTDARRRHDRALGVIASLPFAPEIVVPTIRHLIEWNLREMKSYGFKATFNATFPGKVGKLPAWVTPWYFGFDQGPIVMMIEN